MENIFELTYLWYMNICKYKISHLNGIISLYHPTKHSEKLCIDFLKLLNKKKLVVHWYLCNINDVHLCLYIKTIYNLAGFY